MAYDDPVFGIIESVDLEPYQDARLATTASSAIKRMYGFAEFGPIVVTQIAARTATAYSKASALTITMHVDGVDRATIVQSTPQTANAVTRKSCEVNVSRGSMIGFDYSGAPNDACVTLSMAYRRLNNSSYWTDQD